MILKRFQSWLQTDFFFMPRFLWLWAGFVFFSVLGLGAVMYQQFQYSGLDLGIYHQVLWNTARGRLFEFSFNEHSYLVDHREWLLLIFAPIYWVSNHPFVLVVVQAFIVNSIVIPTYFVARTIFQDTVLNPKRVAVLVAAATLIHPTVFNMQLFEFHMLALAAPLAMWWWYGITQRAWWRWIFFVLLLLTREDVALTTAAMGVVLFSVDPKRWKESIGITSTSIVWFAAMVWVGAYLSIEDNPLFFSVYSWMGESPVEALYYIVTHPIAVLQHIISVSNIFLFLLFLMSSAFLPLFAFRYTLPALLGLSVYFFMQDIEIGMDIFLYHYGALIAVSMIIASMYGYRRLFDRTKAWRVPVFTQKDMDTMAMPFVCIVLVATWVFFGAHWRILDIFMIYPEDRSGIRAAIERIPEDVPVTASLRTYPQLASRQFLYPDKYIRTGLKHYSDLPYQFQPFEWLVLTDDFFHIQNNQPIQKKASAVQRLRQQIAINNLVPIQLFEQGVLYGSASATEGVSVQPIRSADAFVPDVVVHAQVHPTARLDGYTYNSERQEFSLQLTRLHSAQAQQFRNTYPDDQELFVRIVWKNVYHIPARTQYRLLGSATDPLYLWGDGESKVMQLPWKIPKDATEIRLEFGSIYLPPQQFTLSRVASLQRKPLPGHYENIEPIIPIESTCFSQPSTDSAYISACSVNTR